MNVVQVMKDKAAFAGPRSAHTTLPSRRRVLKAVETNIDSNDNNTRLQLDHRY